MVFRRQPATKTISAIGSSGLLALQILTVLAASQAFGQSRPKFDSVAIDAPDPGAWNGVVFLARAFQQPASTANPQPGLAIREGGAAFDVPAAEHRVEIVH